MSVQKEARRDAAEYARALMYYGEGAGTRRKLITTTVESKSQNKKGYHEAFAKELARQDMGEHAAKARKERERHDRNEAVGRNVRGVVTGDYRSLNTGIIVAGAVAYWAYKTGYDRKIYYAARDKAARVKQTLKAKYEAARRAG